MLTKADALRIKVAFSVGGGRARKKEAGEAREVTRRGRRRGGVREISDSQSVCGNFVTPRSRFTTPHQSHLHSILSPQLQLSHILFILRHSAGSPLVLHFCTRFFFASSANFRRLSDSQTSLIPPLHPPCPGCSNITTAGSGRLQMGFGYSRLIC